MAESTNEKTLSIEAYIESLFEKKDENSKKSYIPEICFFTGIASFSLLVGFGSSLAMVKKKDPEAFNKGLQTAREMLHEDGVSLAMKALRKATLYSVSGATLLSIVIYKFFIPKSLPVSSKVKNIK